MRVAGATRFTPANCVLDGLRPQRRTRRLLRCFAALSPNSASLYSGKPLFGQVFKTKPLRAAGFRAKSDACGKGRIAGGRPVERGQSHEKRACAVAWFGLLLGRLFGVGA